jgi:hypothetical protein
MINWPDLKLPPINLWNAPSQNYIIFHRTKSENFQSFNTLNGQSLNNNNNKKY